MYAIGAVVWAHLHFAVASAAYFQKHWLHSISAMNMALVYIYIYMLLGFNTAKLQKVRSLVDIRYLMSVRDEIIHASQTVASEHIIFGVCVW